MGLRWVRWRERVARLEARVSAAAEVKRWSAGRKKQVVLRLLRGESVDALSRELAVPIYRLEEWRARLPAVTHVDGTGRLQTVENENNPLYHRLISAFKRRTGLGMVLNTSFNENEPIVDTPEQALDCFRRTDMDALCLGRYVLKKPHLGQE